jgi:hypothetical protein
MLERMRDTEHVLTAIEPDELFDSVTQRTGALGVIIPFSVCAAGRRGDPRRLWLSGSQKGTLSDRSDRFRRIRSGCHDGDLIAMRGFQCHNSERPSRNA